MISITDGLQAIYNSNMREKTPLELERENRLLRQQIDKAIEYINKHFEDGEGIICKIIDEHTCDANYNFLEDLINILEGK